MDINNVVKLSVDKCISIYNEMVKEIQELDGSGKIYGTVPKSLVIKYGKGILKKTDYILTDILNTWYYCGGDLTESEKIQEPIKEPVSGMFYPEASAEFMVDEERGHVYLSYYFGPRYARGVRYTLEGQADLVRLSQEEVLWVS